MRHIAATIAAVTAAVTAACSIPEKQLYPPFGCYQQPLPDRAQDVIKIRGSVVIPSMFNAPASGALIQMYLNGDVIAHVNSRTDGSFEIPQRTNNRAPLAVFFKVSHVPQEDYLDTYFYPSVPLTEDLDGVDLQLLTTGQATQSLSMMGVDLDLRKILLAITVVDCNHVPQGGATVSAAPVGDPIHYLVDDEQGFPSPSASATVTDQQAGTGFAANVPITNTAANTSDILIGATMPLPTNSSTILTLRGHAITGVVPGAVIQADIQP